MAFKPINLQLFRSLHASCNAFRRFVFLLQLVEGFNKGRIYEYIFWDERIPRINDVCWLKTEKRWFHDQRKRMAQFLQPEILMLLVIVYFLLTFLFRWRSCFVECFSSVCGHECFSFWGSLVRFKSDVCWRWVILLGGALQFVSSIFFWESKESFKMIQFKLSVDLRLTCPWNWFFVTVAFHNRQLVENRIQRIIGMRYAFCAGIAESSGFLKLIARFLDL